MSFENLLVGSIENSDISTFLKNYSNKNDIVLTENNMYYFYVMNKNNINGIQICISPKTSDIEIYNVKNNKKNFNNINENGNIKTSSHIIEYILFVLQYNTTILNHCKYIYKYLANNFINNNFKIIHKDYYIKIIQTNTRNGFYIYFDNYSYANIGIIIENSFFNVNKIVIKSLNELLPNLNDLINNNSHFVKFIDVVDSKYSA
jgi:hypothetical protein